ncbi:MAG: choice-of-anchor Q domain-containing protein [Kiritimatiellae bacterium]|nr:choice-of-anchor Q domain-containing protein [Kiritimatiellia bacterium]
MKHYLIGLTAVLLICFFGICACSGDTHYAATNMLSVEPYTSWENAASNIQWAADAATEGDTVLVSNGVYEAGGLTNYPTGTLLTNRLVITSAITVTSVNGASVTAIKGAWASNGQTNGLDSVRCVYMSAGTLIGFTITNGATRVSSSADGNGGGIYCPSTSPGIPPVISNCVIAGNAAYYYGAGVYYGTMCNTIVKNNNGNNSVAARGVIIYHGNAVNCTISNNSGGGSMVGYSVLSNCAVVNNASVSGAGGVQNCNLANCLIAVNSGNLASVTINESGYWIKNSTIVSNYCANSNVGGGMYFTVGKTATVENCVIYDNHFKNLHSIEGAGGIFTNCCVFPTNSSAILAGSVNNIESDPQFANKAAGDWRLKAGSPCVNAGINRDWMTNSVDLDGTARLRYGRVDMGAYECIYSGTICGFR